MSKQTQITDTKPQADEYRLFNLPGFGRVRAPADMTEDSLLAALRHDEPDNTTGD